MGVNVWFWGPCLWSILEAVCRCVDLTVAAAEKDPALSELALKVVQWADRFLRSALAVAPCPFCRQSSDLFLKELEAQWGEPLAHIFAQRQSLRFLHMLHGKVNMKLHAQHLEKFGVKNVTFGDRCCTVPPREISFDTFYRRTMLRQRLFGVEDVLWMLHALRLDFQPALASHYLTFFDCLCKLVAMDAKAFDGNGRSIASAGAPMQVLFGILNPLATQVSLQPEMLSVQEGFNRVVLIVTAAMSNKKVSRDNAAALQKTLFAPFNQMKVGVVCAHETCALPRPPPKHVQLALDGRPAIVSGATGGIEDQVPRSLSEFRI